MRVYLHQGLDPDRIPNFDKMRSRLEAGDFRSADTRKVGDNLFRARLDHSNRILFSFARHGEETCILVLEYIPNHDYAKSRFLRLGATVDEIDPIDAVDAKRKAGAPPPPTPEPEDEMNLAYVNPGRGSFHVLDKVIFLDDAQHEAFALAPPFIVIGSAGSGKTLLVLEKLKQAVGDVLYVTRSPPPGRPVPGGLLRPELRQRRSGSEFPVLCGVPGEHPRSADPGGFLRGILELVLAPPTGHGPEGRIPGVRGVRRRHHGRSDRHPRTCPWKNTKPSVCAGRSTRPKTAAASTACSSSTFPIFRIQDDTMSTS